MKLCVLTHKQSKNFSIYFSFGSFKKLIKIFNIKMLLFKIFHLNVVTICVTLNALMVALYFSNLNAAPAGALKPRYDVFEYATLEDSGGSAVVSHLNKAKKVVGGFRRGIAKKTSQAFVLNANGFEDVTNDPSIDFSTTYAINDRNETVGAINNLTDLRPFRSIQLKSFHYLTLLPGDKGGIAYGINDNSEVVGYSSGKYGERAVWWSSTGVIQLLEGLPEGSSSQARDINDSGQIVGTIAGTVKRAVLWLDKSKLIDLGTLANFNESEAVSISNNGTIAGNAIGLNFAPNFRRAVLWEPGKHLIRDLGALQGGDESRANDVNLRSEVVGTSSTSDHGSRAFIWTPTEGMVDLNALITLPGVVLTEATGINNQGDIVAIGHDIDIAELPHNDGHIDHEGKRKIYVLSARP